MSIPPQFRTVVHDQNTADDQAVRRPARTVEAQPRSLPDRATRKSTALLVSDPAGAGWFKAEPANLWIRLLAHLRASNLDRQLASGLAPESSRTMAARAETLVSRPWRQSLAENWQELSERAVGRPAIPTGRAPLCRDRIIGADRHIREMVRALSSPLPVPAQGVAMASWLLTDGAGPLYNRKCATDLSVALGRVVELLDPTTALSQQG
jgi:hypothetical protein